MNEEELAIYARAYERATNRALMVLGRHGVKDDHPDMVLLRAVRDDQWTKAGLPVPR